MRWMIASDIHGSATWCRALLDAFAREGTQRLLLLGDILYHGPRNDLPDGYAPREVIAMLAPLRARLLCVRGNCDTEVDQMVLPFPILADYAVCPLGDRLMYLTHGHRYGEETPPPLAPGDLLVCGHTHVPKAAAHGDYVYLNPGSVSLPKEGSPHGYILLEGETFTWKHLRTGAAWRAWQVGDAC